jgi:hypothetical protein
VRAVGRDTSPDRLRVCRQSLSGCHGNGGDQMAERVPGPVQALLDAANAGDTEAFLAGFSEDGLVDDWGREFVGAALIRGWSDAEFIGKQVTLQIDQIAEHAGETVVTAQVGGNGFNGPSHFSFRVAGELVARMTIRA